MIPQLSFLFKCNQSYFPYFFHVVILDQHIGQKLKGVFMMSEETESAKKTFIEMNIFIDKQEYPIVFLKTPELRENHEKI